LWVFGIEPDPTILITLNPQITVTIDLSLKSPKENPNPLPLIVVLSPSSTRRRRWSSKLQPYCRPLIEATTLQSKRISSKLQPSPLAVVPSLQPCLLAVVLKLQPHRSDLSPSSRGNFTPLSIHRSLSLSTSLPNVSIALSLFSTSALSQREQRHREQRGRDGETTKRSRLGERYPERREHREDSLLYISSPFALGLSLSRSRSLCCLSLHLSLSLCLCSPSLREREREREQIQRES